MLFRSPFERLKKEGLRYQQLTDIFGSENISKIAPEDLKIAYQIENAGSMSFSKFQEEIQKMKEGITEPTGFDLTAYQEQIDNFQNTVGKLSSILEKINSGSLSGSELIDLQQEFPELAGKADDLGFAIQEFTQNELSELLKTLGENAPEDLVDSLTGIADEVSNASTGVLDLDDALSNEIGRAHV